MWGVRRGSNKLGRISPGDQRLSGKKWRAMIRRRRRAWLAEKSPREQRRLSGRKYFDRAANTRIVRANWKAHERYKRQLASVTRKLAKFRAAFLRLGSISSVPVVWNCDENWCELDSFSVSDAPTSYDVVFPIVSQEKCNPSTPSFLSYENPDDVSRLVESLDNPTRMVAHFIGLSAKDHARNVEAAVHRAEIMFNEAKTDKFKLRDASFNPDSRDPDFIRRYRETPCVVDTGASYGLTPFREDFITYESCSIKVKAVAHENTVIGMGIVLYKCRATNGDTCFLPGIAYHLPQCGIRLLSPQAYHQQYSGHSTIDGEKFTFLLARAANGPRKHEIRVPFQRSSNLPMLFDVSTTGMEKAKARPYFARSIKLHQHFCGSFFGRWNTSFQSEDGDEDCYGFTPSLHVMAQDDLISFNNCVTGENNPNLSAGMKELALWHYRLGISMKHVQFLMNSHESKDAEGNSIQVGPVIRARHKDARTCNPTIKCATCEIAKGRAQKPGNVASNRDKTQDKALSREKYMPGDMVSMDTVPVGVPGRAYSGYGGPNAGVVFSHFTLFHDAATGIIKIYLQQNGSAASTLYAKRQFEDFMWREAGVVVKHYHSDQGSNFTDAKFAADCEEKHQTQSFSGSYAKFENDLAERAVQTVLWKARHMMLHCALRWDCDGCSDPNLWPQALLYSTWLYNRIPKMDTFFSPMELLTSRRDDHHDLLRAKVFGCPSYVLDPVLADGKKLPKFSRRTRVGQFMGFNEEFSSLVGQIRNLQSGSITEQYHVVYDERFESVIGLTPGNHEEDLDAYVQKLWQELFKVDYARDFYIEPQYSRDPETDEPVLEYEVPPLHDEWLTAQEVREKEERLQQQLRRDIQRKERYEQKFRPKTPKADRRVRINESKNSVVPASPTDKSDVSADGAPVSSSPEGAVDGEAFDSEGDIGDVDFEVEETPSNGEQLWNSRRRRTRTNWRTRYGDDFVTDHVEVTRSNWEHAKAFSAAQMASLSLAEKAVLRSPYFSPYFGNFGITLGNERQMETPLRYHPRTRDPVRYPDAEANMSLELADALADDKAEADLRSCNTLYEEATTLESLVGSRLSQFVTLSTNNADYGGGITELVCQDVHPAFLNAKLGISKADNPGWEEAMNGPEAAEYWKAAEVEIATLEKMGAWEVVDRPPKATPVLKSLWAFKRKRLPSGEIRKYKARSTARGDMQTPDVDFTETWAPVVQWTTVRMMLILAMQLDLKTWSADVSCAFLHSDIDSEVYVEMPRGFTKPGKVLKLKKSLYGLRQSPRLFWKYLTESMAKCGLKQSHLDPCLFIGDEVIALCYVDDILFFAKDDRVIEKLMVELRDTGLQLEKESSAAGFLGIDIKPRKDAAGNTIELELTQCGLIDRIISNLGLDDKPGKAYAKATPYESSGPLTKDPDGEPCIEAFSFPAVVGQLLYLTGHTRPELAFAVNQCARYMFDPKRSHELALIRIGKYLKATRSKGLIIKPSGGLLNINAYPDADFAGLYGHEKSADPACVKSRTGFVITVANCPISWKSTLQSKTALSTMEAEISAMAHCMKELIGIMDLADMLAKHYGLKPVKTQMNVTLFEDNAGALVLAKTLPPEFTPRSKFYQIETIWFREQINLRGIKVEKIDTHEQLGDIFTKGLSREVFEYLRKKLCGW